MTVDFLGQKVSRIGFGCAPIGGYDYGPVDDDESVRAIHQALDLGLNFFDTADVYGLGHAEEVLGKALKGRGDQIILGTKVGLRWDESGKTWHDLSPSWIKEALEGSLKRLQVNHVDLYQIHWPDPNTPIEQTLSVLQKLKEAGKVRAIGCCNFSPDQLETACQITPIVSLQLPYNLLQRESGNFLHQVKNNLGLTTLNYNALAHGYLSGKYDETSSFESTDLRNRYDILGQGAFSELKQSLKILKEVGERYGKSVAQVALRWLLDSGNVSIVLVGIKTALQAKENSGALAWQLSEEDKIKLDSLGLLGVAHSSTLNTGQTHHARL